MVTESFRTEDIPLGIYGVILLPLVLGALAMGGPLFGIMIFAVLFPALGVAHAGLTSLRLRMYQEFSEFRVLKGDALDFKLHLENGLKGTSARIDLEFQMSGPLKTAEHEYQTLWLKKREEYNQNVDLTCRYRGIYTLGLKSLEIRDTLGWFALRVHTFPQTFYVYPRVFERPNRDMPLLGSLDPTAEGRSGRQPDPTLFDSLSPYRPGEDLRHVVWKRLAQGGEPILRRFLPEPVSGVLLILDLHRESHSPGYMEAQGLMDEGYATEKLLDREDSSVEAALSLTKALVDEGIQVNFLAQARRDHSVDISGEGDFQVLMEQSVQWDFGPEAPSSRLLWTHHSLNRGEPPVVIVITHRQDPLLLNHMKQNPGSCQLIVNLAGLSETEGAEVRASWQDSLPPGQWASFMDSSESFWRDVAL